MLPLRSPVLWQRCQAVLLAGRGKAPSFFMNPIKTINPLHSLAEAVSLFESLRTLDEAGNRVLRAGIRNNLVTFPSEVSVFKKTTRPDLQAKIAVLYFVRGWSTARIGERYRIGRQRVAQIVTKWRIRAVCHGYVQLITEATLVPVHFLHELSEESAIGAGYRPPPTREIRKLMNLGSFKSSTRDEAEQTQLGQDLRSGRNRGTVKLGGPNFEASRFAREIG